MGSQMLNEHLIIDMHAGYQPLRRKEHKTLAQGAGDGAELTLSHAGPRRNSIVLMTAR